MTADGGMAGGSRCSGQKAVTAEGSCSGRQEACIGTDGLPAADW